MGMKHIATLLCALLIALTTPTQLRAVDFSNEQLNYDIVFQWGVIWKHAGDAALSIKRTSSGYQAQLVGKTRSWADKVYPMRDTLKCTMNNKLQPLRYEKLTHEKSYSARDVVTFSYNYSTTNAKGFRYRPGRPTSEVTLTAKCQAYDMLSVFYMLRNLDYDKFITNKIHSTVIFSGKEKEYLTITYKGKEKVKLRDHTQHDAYHLKFRFTQEGGKKSSDNIDVWISIDAKRIPLLLQGKLPVGAVKCYYRK